MLGELVEWIVNLDRDMAFLFALPFMVAAAGLAVHALENRGAARKSHRDTRAPGAARSSHI